MEQKQITKEDLEKVKYHELQEKLTELGIPEVWSSKVKKAVVIENAINALSKLKKIKEANPNKDEQEIKDQLALDQLLEKEEIQKKEIQAQLQKEVQEEEDLKNLKKKELSREDIEKNIAIIKTNLDNNIPGQRDILVGKFEKLTKLLDSM